MAAPIDIPIGASASQSVTVTHDLTVAHAVPGMPEVYATPMMIYLLEIVSASAIQPYLPAGHVSVGTAVNVRHLAATPVGFVVTATAAVQSIDGRIVTFSVKAHDGEELIADGTHSRAIVELERFNARVAAKRNES